MFRYVYSFFSISIHAPQAVNDSTAIEPLSLRFNRYFFANCSTTPPFLLSPSVGRYFLPMGDPTSQFSI